MNRFFLGTRFFVGAFGVKRLRPEHRGHIPGVLDYCRTMYERQVPFDFGFHLDEAALYCVELTEIEGEPGGGPRTPERLANAIVASTVADC